MRYKILEVIRVAYIISSRDWRVLVRRSERKRKKQERCRHPTNLPRISNLTPDCIDHTRGYMNRYYTFLADQTNLPDKVTLVRIGNFAPSLSSSPFQPFSSSTTHSWLHQTIPTKHSLTDSSRLVLSLSFSPPLRRRPRIPSLSLLTGCRWCTGSPK